MKKEVINSILALFKALFSLLIIFLGSFLINIHFYFYILILFFILFFFNMVWMFLFRGEQKFYYFNKHPDEIVKSQKIKKALWYKSFAGPGVYVTKIHPANLSKTQLFLYGLIDLKDVFKNMPLTLNYFEINISKARVIIPWNSFIWEFGCRKIKGEINLKEIRVDGPFQVKK